MKNGKQLLKELIKENELEFVQGIEYIKRTKLDSELKHILNSLPETCGWCNEKLHELEGGDFICEKHYQQVRQ